MSVCTVGIGRTDPALPGRQVHAAVSSWSLCTIPDAVAALQELRRVLRPGARLHFVEHGLADKEVRRCQRRLEPLQIKTFAGCYLTRPVTDLLNSTGFIIEELDVFYEKGAPNSLQYIRWWCRLGAGVAMNGAYQSDSAGFTITGTPQVAGHRERIAQPPGQLDIVLLSSGGAGRSALPHCPEPLI